MSIKAKLESLNGQNVTKTIANVLTVEQWPEYVIKAKKQLEAQGFTVVRAI